MRHFLTLLSICTICTFLTTSCSSGGGGESQQMNYKDMKSMVIDILKTEDAQKALQESASAQSGYTAQSSTLLNVQDQEKIKIAVKDVMSSPEYDSVIKSLMTDTRFAGEFAKAVNDMNKDLHEQLVKDPQYQEGLVAAFESEEMQKVILKVIKGTEYRKEVTSLMQESLKNPIFRLEMLELMKKAVSEELSTQPQSGGGDSSGSNDSSSTSNSSSSNSSKKSSDSSAE
ncbi:MAG: spore germination lipoprotein GerD [Candidatus Pristimantibacillus lignocellulolyticus]|uniref:Spore germination lipoprotein GerD n=1 Tax=Candidatus Pristimantibacillus lignocellulolyticus TaxID=2994561 RepID=A0A9J6ZJ23_9BACL|nr:MAG: spore germination lipoprotein GerD [Candidatus Pristimantibacillus lignocellulolyticus]